MTRTGTSLVSLLGPDPTTYVPHVLHAETRAYPETNCYTDVIVELLHACGYEPLAAMGFTVRVDFEGDQWTFFKPPPEDLEQLFGLDVHEMQPYRPLPDQAAEQLEQGRTLLVELDSFYLPDTAATTYRREHVKSSAAIESIDRDRRLLRYFHNRSLYELEGDDYIGVFRLDGRLPADVLPPYTELVRFDARPPVAEAGLREAARELLSRHLGRRPAANPFERFGEALVRTLPALVDADAPEYHAYAFATVRMAGAAFEVCASHVDWLFGDEGGRAVDALLSIPADCKVLSLKLARRRVFDPEPVLARLAAAWERAQLALDSVAG